MGPSLRECSLPARTRGAAWGTHVTGITYPTAACCHTVWMKVQSPLTPSPCLVPCSLSQVQVVFLLLVLFLVANLKPASQLKTIISLVPLISLSEHLHPFHSASLGSFRIPILSFHLGSPVNVTNASPLMSFIEILRMSSQSLSPA